jgi:thiamine-phosphate pyrophosphorylase
MNMLETIDCINFKPAIVKQDRRNMLTGLYAITNASLTEADTLIRQVEQALIGGTRIIQYRNKFRDKNANQRLQTCLALRELTRRYDALLIVNDDVELARITQADGVHLGMDDMNPQQAREQLEQDKIIGISCYNRFDLAKQAVKAGADYVAFGSFFPSTTKPDAVKAEIEILKQAKETLDVPIVAIGGITPENGQALIEAGTDMLAVVDGVFGQTDIEAAARRFHDLFQ